MSAKTIYNSLTMNIYPHITLALLLAMPAAACMADDFNYDDDATVEITDDDWGDHDLTIGIEDITTGVSSPAATPELQEAEITVACGHLVITAPRAMTLPIYRLDMPAAEYLNLPAGTTSIELPHGIYIIAGRKYML